VVVGKTSHDRWFNEKARSVHDLNSVISDDLHRKLYLSAALDGSTSFFDLLNSSEVKIDSGLVVHGAVEGLRV